MAINTRALTDHHGPLIPPPQFQERFQERLQEGLQDKALAGADLEKAIDELMVFQSDHWISVCTDGELVRTNSNIIDPVAEVKRMRPLTDARLKVRLPRASETVMTEASVISGLLDAGCGYIQLDGAAYLPLIHQAGRAALKAQGKDPDAMLEQMLAADRAVLSEFKVDIDEVKMAVCLHDPFDFNSVEFSEDLDWDAAKRLLPNLPVNRFLFDGGLGTPDYTYLSLLPDSTQVVLCNIDANAETVEDGGEIMQRSIPAADVIDTDRFALSLRHVIRKQSWHTPVQAWQHQGEVFTALLDASSRAWGIDF